MTHKSELLNTFIQRGYFHQCTDLDALDKRALKPITGYIGFDCTAASLHIGSLVMIMMLRWMQKLGHTPIALIGGGTTKIGDPSGRDASRQILTQEQININKKGIQANLEQFISFGDKKHDAQLVDNADWLDKLELIPFLRDYGPHFSINRMLTFDSVKTRLDREQSLSLLEFNYMIFQAYDFVELARNHDCTLQLGGSDQWGNIVNGVELARRTDARSLYGLTAPLVTTSTGAKMGKTADGAVWLSPDMLSAYDYWQYWRNISDSDIGRFLRLFTELPIDEIERLENLQGSEINEAKIILANEATQLCRGKEAAEKAKNTAKNVFESGQKDAGLPVLKLTDTKLKDGMSILDLLVEANLVQSKGEARRLIRGGGARINDEQVISEDQTIASSDFISGDIKLSSGKKKHILISLKS